MSTTTLEMAPVTRSTAQGVTRNVMEIATALTLAMIGAAAIWDSHRLGMGWGREGPQTRFLPFRVRVHPGGASFGKMPPVLGGRGEGSGEMFVTWPQLRLVMAVLIPTVFYIAA